MDRKRGITPVLATALLVGLTVILASVVFLYSRQFIDENIEKNGREISLECEEVSFIAESVGGKIYIENTGAVPLYGLDVKKKSLFDVETFSQRFDNPSVSPGQNAEINLPAGISKDEKIIVSPMLLGEVSGESKKKAHICDVNYGQEILVK